ncbi:helix-turn-helix domain-containing protein [Pseudomonas leptonychotis]|uniref:helix-turn-helix domain-containing protein n=1 Tax=Pseudomonas leptonychotis TaxID=2448482 RepID=UPI00386D08AE
MMVLISAPVNISGAEICMINVRLKEERERLGFTQPDFAAAAGAAKRTLIEWEKGSTSPNAVQIAALSSVGVDVLYVLTGRRAESNGATSHHLPAQPSSVIDPERLSRIVEMLETTARLAGRKWQIKKLVAVAAEVYNVLADEPALDEPKVERILKLVVNR